LIIIALLTTLHVQIIMSYTKPIHYVRVKYTVSHTLPTYTKTSTNQKALRESDLLPMTVHSIKIRFITNVVGIIVLKPSK